MANRTVSNAAKPSAGYPIMWPGPAQITWPSQQLGAGQLQDAYRLTGAGFAPPQSQYMALHKMMHLLTATCGDNAGCLNFAQNVLACPEWAGFETTQQEEELFEFVPPAQYSQLQWWNSKVRQILQEHQTRPAELVKLDEEAQTLVYARGDFLFVFNFHPQQDNTIGLTRKSNVRLLLSLHSNWQCFGGTRHGSYNPLQTSGEQVKIYTDKKSAAVYKMVR